MGTTTVTLTPTPRISMTIMRTIIRPNLRRRARAWRS
jgi:hypothetical protein